MNLFDVLMKANDKILGQDLVEDISWDLFANVMFCSKINS